MGQSIYFANIVYVPTLGSRCTMFQEHLLNARAVENWMYHFQPGSVRKNECASICTRATTAAIMQHRLSGNAGVPYDMRCDPAYRWSTVPSLPSNFLPFQSVRTLPRISVRSSKSLKAYLPFFFLVLLIFSLAAIVRR
eukprot:gb/GECG01008490.1/.p1 GENE.gb/GECG01008490.1/~~gb/GECG01008490.1/.p1  ORF type:complete len:138 (+),score=4.48 gb/GECG01008490.1/:1-414(+)